MNCESRQRQISRLADSEISIEESAEVFEHLGECKTCREFYFQLQTLTFSMEQVRKLEIPLTLGSGGRMQTRKPSQLKILWSRQVAVRFPVVALLVCALAIGIFFSIQTGLKPRGRETVYLMKLPEVVITSNAVGSTDRK
jgi:predicted anti-sigma-YlaC factor YlaD